MYLRLPLTQRSRLRLLDLGYTLGAGLFAGMPHYEAWKRNTAATRSCAPLRAPKDVRPPEQLIGGLAFPETQEPLVSIVIASFGELTVTARCLASLQRFRPTCSFELIVIENVIPGSPPSVLGAVPGLRYLTNEANLPFLECCNRASRFARGRFLAFLSDDTQVRENWLERLVQTFERFPDAGIAGSKLVYPNGMLQEAGAIVWNDGSAWSVGRLDDPNASRHNFVHEVDYCSDTSLLIRRETFEEVGGFSAAYAPTYYEDTDLAFKVRALGKRVYYQPGSVVIHHERVLPMFDPGRGTSAYQRTSAETFRKRWKEVLRKEQFSYGNSVVLAAERISTARVVLVVDQYIPRPDRDAGSRSVDQLMTELVAQGWIVKFWPNNLWFDPEYGERLQQRGIEIFYGLEYADCLVDVVRALGPMLHAVILNRPRIAEEYLDALRTVTRARMIYSGIDIHFLRLRLQRSVEPIAVSGHELKLIEQLERSLWRRADVVWYPSADEAKIVRESEPNARVEVLPLYVFGNGRPAPPRDQRDEDKLMFLAGFSHPPNADAAQWFVAEILPRIRKHRPKVRIWLVGSNPGESVRRLHGDGVVVTGFVPEETLLRHFDTAMVSVVPLRYGAGVKGKVVESLQYGVPLVTTSVGAQGLPDVDQVACITDDAQAFAAKVLELLDSPSLWERHSKRMQSYARANFSVGTMHSVIRSAIGDPPTRRAEPRVPVDPAPEPAAITAQYSAAK